MHSLFEEGDAYTAELERIRLEEKSKVEAKRALGGSLTTGKGKKLKSLRETDPW